MRQESCDLPVIVIVVILRNPGRNSRRTEIPVTCDYVSGFFPKLSISPYL